jgi:tRNA threonylcarbamoyladenosine modification (KEOPS) complex  Pcc1 subunit
MTSRRAAYRIPCDSQEQAHRLERALSIEAEAGPPRTKIHVASEGDVLVITIDADDSRGLRAATNSFLRWAHTALEVDRIAGRTPGKPSA